MLLTDWGKIKINQQNILWGFNELLGQGKVTSPQKHNRLPNLHTPLHAPSQDGDSLLFFLWQILEETLSDFVLRTNLSLEIKIPDSMGREVLLKSIVWGGVNLEHWLVCQGWKMNIIRNDSCH